MKVDVRVGSEAAIVGPDSTTGKTAMVSGDLVFVAESVEAVEMFAEDAARWARIARAQAITQGGTT